jgi:PIN domain nuclease of toxin-antitoxin system
VGSEPLTLLDTHALVWLAEGLPDLGPEAKAAADQSLAEGRLAVSAISFWEVAMLGRKGRLELMQPPDVWREELLALGLAEIPVTGDVGIAAANLPGFHADPADRFIAATASLFRAELITGDGRILEWVGPLHRRDARK